ncbi:MAG: transporter substrate-binding domain-containing protein [Acetobacteraceae bacterium]
MRRRDVMGGMLGAALVPAASAATVSLWDQIKETGVIRYGLIPSRVPYQWEKDGKLAGLSVRIGADMAAALEKAMGRRITVEHVITTWATLILDLQAGKSDCMFGLTDTEERRKAVDMFGPLYAVPDVAVLRGDGPPGATWEDFNRPDMVVSVTMGTSDEDAVRRFMPKATVHAMKTATEAILDVQSGNAKLFVTPLLIGAPLMQRNPNMKRMVVLQPPYALPSGGAARKDTDRRFAEFAAAWATDYRESGRSRQAIVDAMLECGFDMAKLEGGVSF